MKLYILELDLRPIGKNTFLDVPDNVELAVEESGQCELVPIREALKEMVLHYLEQTYSPSNEDNKSQVTQQVGLKLAKAINTSLDEFLTTFSYKITHSENHDDAGSFTWTSRVTDSRKRIIRKLNITPM